MIGGSVSSNTRKRWINVSYHVPELAAIRRTRGISLQEIAERTKISIRSLEAIECGEFRKLPGGIYTTSYLRQYARAIDYDEDALLQCYYSQSVRAPVS